MRPHTSVTAALDEMGFGKVQLLLLLYCGLAWSADACETMLLSFLGPSVRCAWGVGPAAESVLTSVVFVGMLSGVYSLGVVSDHLGRRRGFLVSALLLGGAGLASAFAPSFGWLLLLRAVVGFALGGTPVAVTLFAELCPSAGRGSWLLLMQGFWTLGTVMEALLAWAVLPTLGWRWLLALSALPLGLLLALYPLLPESPHWLFSKQRYAEVEAVLQRVAAASGRNRPLLLRLAPGSGGAAPGAAEWQKASGNGGHGRVCCRSSTHLASAALAASPGVQAPLLTTTVPTGGTQSQTGTRRKVDQQAESQQHHGRQRQQQQLVPHELDDSSSLAATAPQWRLELCRTVTAAFATVFGPQLRCTTLLLYAIWAVNALTYYGLVLLTTALQTAGKKEECTSKGAPNLDSGDFETILITTMAEAPGLLTAALLIDGKGRKWTLRAGLAVCTVALVSLILDPPRAGQLGLLFVARGCIEGTFSALYVYTPELYPTSVRSVGLALCNGFGRLGGFLAPFATVYLVAGGRSHDAEALLGSLCACATLCALLLPYETRGRDLQRTDLQPEGAGATSKERSGQGHASGSAAEAHAGESNGLHSVGLRRSIDGEVELESAHEHEHEDDAGPLLRTWS